MSISTVLDPAESWLAEQLLGSDISIYANNANLVRSRLKQRVFEDIRNLVATARLEAPFDPGEIAKHRHVLNIKEDDGLISKEAVLVPTNGGFVIIVSSRVQETRKRCSCAHEIAHTYFYDVTVDPPRKFYRSGRYWVEEGYACEIAREILMPEPYFSTYVFKHNLHLSVEALKELRNDFRVSYDLLSRRLLHDAHTWNKEFWEDRLWQGIIIIVLSPAPKKNINKKHEVKVHRSPGYKCRLKDVTSTKLERKLGSVVVEKTPRNEDKDPLAKTANTIVKTLRDKLEEKKEEDIEVGASSYHIQAQRVGKTSVLAVIN